MARIDPLKPEQMNDAQAQAYEAALARGGRLGGPNGIHLRVPELFEINQEMSTYFRSNTLPARLRQLAVLVAVRHWEGAYAWGVQARASMEVGIPKEVVEAINARQEPDFGDALDQVVHDVASELVRRAALGDALFARAHEALGFNQLLDLIATVGFYSAVAMWVNVFEVDPPADIPIPLAP